MQNFSNFLNQIESKRLCRFQTDVNSSNIDFKCMNLNTFLTVESSNGKINDNIHIHDNNLNNTFTNTSNNSTNLNGLYTTP